MLKKTFCSFVMISILPLAACIDDPTGAADEPALGETSSPLFAHGVAPGSARFMVKNGGMCIAAPVSGNGPVVQLPCASEPRFWWNADPDRVADPTGQNRIFRIHNRGFCLDVPDLGGSSLTQSGANIQAFPCAGMTQLNQQFILRRFAIGEYQIKPRLAADLCLDIETGTTAAGNALQQYTCKTIDVENQRFLLRPRLYEEKGLDCDDSDIMHVTTTSSGSDTVPNDAIVHIPAGPFQRIQMTCDGDTETRTCNGFTAQIDRLRPAPTPTDDSGKDEYTFTCWE